MRNGKRKTEEGKKPPEAGEDGRQGAERDGMEFRSSALELTAEGRPATWDEKTRSVRHVLATEAPVPMWDWRRSEMVPEVLLMSGLELPGSRQVPLLDSHEMWSTDGVIGSDRELTIEGTELVGRAVFDTGERGEDACRKTREGHLTDFSAGYKVQRGGVRYVPAGEEQVINGRSFRGPVNVVTAWRIRESSICPVGRDEGAKVRGGDDAHDGQENAEGTQNMDEKLRKELEAIGLRAGATEDEALEFVRSLKKAPEAPKPPAPVVNEAQVRAAEQERQTGIRALARRFGEADEKVVEGWLTSSRSVENVQFEAVERALARVQAAAPRVNVTLDEGDKFRAAAADGLMLRAGFEVEKPAPGATEVRGFTMVELARDYLRRTCRPSDGLPDEIMRRALGTSDFPLVLANVANKSLKEGWDSADETCDAWTSEKEVANFLAHKTARPSETEDLEEVPENGEYHYSYRDEEGETLQVTKYGRLLSYSWESGINDDLGALTDTPRQFGESCKRKTGDVVYAVLTANAAMGDTVALFHATHANLVDHGSGGAPAEATLNAAELAMASQKDLLGKRRLRILPVYLLAPFALKGSAEVFFQSERFTTSDNNSTRTNVWAGDKLQRVYETRLDDNDAAQWYLAGRKGMTVARIYLRGHRSPFLEQKQGFETDGVTWKCRWVIGAKALDWRGLYCNDGN